MNLTRCEKGHFYDMDKFSSCPHCSSKDEEMNETVRYSSSVTADDAEMVDTIPYSEEKEGNSEDGGGLKELINTIGADEGENGDDEGVTVRYNSGKLSKEPVVGWLVCISGDNSGDCWQLKEGRNFIGRSVNQDITLSDKSVSREKHAIILYEPNRREFIVQPGDSHSLFYMNGNVVLNSEEIHAYDKLVLGNTELLFVPLCGEKFGWDDLEEDV